MAQTPERSGLGARTAASKVLCCQDILAELFDCLDPRVYSSGSGGFGKLRGYYKDSENEKALARSARVCRAFQRPALNVLWRDIKQISRLLAVLPSFIPPRSYSTPHDVPDNGCFSRKPTTQEWNHFQEYAARVRSLSIDRFEEFDADVWVPLTHWCSGSSLLPHLKRLSATFDGRTTCMLVLLSPTITELGIRVDEAVKDLEWGMIYDTLRPSFDKVHRLTISVHKNWRWKHALEIPFWTFSTLRALSIVGRRSIDIDIIQSLSKLSSLRDLELEFEWTQIDATSTSQYTFPCLENVLLSGGFADIQSLINALSAPRLRSLSINAEVYCHDIQRGPLHDLADKFLSLLECIPQLVHNLQISLACLTLHCGHDHPSPNPTQLLKRLLPLKHLEALRLSFQGFLYQFRPDPLLRAMSTVWPNLVELQLEHTIPPYAHSDDHTEYDGGDHIPWYTEDGSLPTVATLVSFVETHPRLRCLTIPGIDLDPVNPLPQLDTIPPLNHGLHYLGTPFLRYDVPLFELARILDKLFPFLFLEGAEDVIPADTAREDFPRARGPELRLLLLALQTGRKTAAGTAGLGV
ncbi:hypothetical protein C8Q78DRAFT_175958 [Trametes maxima]|nr:hypothetical protein C8Q78DRAFT_175958 [Trametes maxima]